MDLFTLTDTFLAKDVIDEFVSSIWTERFTSSGDVQLVLPATAETLEKLKPDTYLALRGTREVMVLQTQQIEDNLLTVTGKTLDEAALKQRLLWAQNPDSTDADARIADYTDATKKPGEFISDIVYKWAISPTAFAGGWAPANLDWANEAIPNLTLGAVDASGTVQRITAPVGELYNAVSRLADQYKVGFSLFLESADPVAGYSLKFKTYQGKDRTSDQTTYPLVRLVPELDGISDIKEIRSSVLEKNVVYVYYQGQISKHLAEPDLPEPEGLARKVMLRDAQGEPPGHTVTFGQQWFGPTYTQYVVTPGELTAFREQNAKDAFANANYIRAIDGQTSPISEYEYGTHYELGDIIELKGLTGAVSKARITEYIRSQDRNGERAYPTISVVT